MNVPSYVLLLPHALAFTPLARYLPFRPLFNVLRWLKWLGLRNDGDTKLITSENYIVESEDIIFDNIKKLVSSKKNTKIIDQVAYLGVRLSKLFTYNSENSIKNQKQG